MLKQLSGSSDIEIGSIFGIYRVEEELKSTPHSIIYIVININTNEYFCMKAFLKKYGKNEIENLSEFEDSDNIIHRTSYYHNFQTDRFYLVFTEFFENGNLKDFLLSRKLDDKIQPFNENYIKRILYKIALGIKELHDNDYVHRDIKLENIFLRNENSPVIGDLGFMLHIEDDQMLGGIVGTQYYMAPEILNNLGYSKPVDIWAFGVMMFTLLTAMFPFDASSDGVIPTDIMSHNNLSEVAVDLITICLTVNQDERATINDVLDHSWFTKKTKREGN